VASNVESKRFGGNSMIVDLSENYKVMKTQILQKNGKVKYLKKLILKNISKVERLDFQTQINFND
jgi:hypothetical protein|tara:strand:+ start:772 stop:966 length:195 start_codon:yes stop_codon:yes gene_type:complete